MEMEQALAGHKKTRARVLLVGSSFSAMPMLKCLRERGLAVTTIGKYKNDPCHRYSDMQILEDYSDPNTLLQICREQTFDFIVPTSNDYSYMSAAFVANEMGFPGFDEAESTNIIHYKNRFREFCQTINVPVPKIYGKLAVHNKIELADFKGKALVKPVDSFSGRGVTLVHDANEAALAATAAFKMSKSGSAVVEEFVEGTLHSHTAFLRSGRVEWYDFVDEFCSVHPYQVDRSHYPSRLNALTRSAVNEAISKIVSELNLVDGLLHTQFIASESEYWIIESMRRCPGDLYGHHFRYALEFDYEDSYVCGFIGERPKFPRRDSAISKVERCVISTSENLPFFASGFRAANREVVFVPLKESGQLLDAAPFDKAGIAFFIGEASGAAFDGNSQSAFPIGYENLQILGTRE